MYSLLRAANQLGSESTKRNLIRESVKLFSLTKRKLFTLAPTGREEISWRMLMSLEISERWLKFL